MDPTVLMCLKWLLDPFFHSTSTGAMLFFAAGLISSLMVLAAGRNMRPKGFPKGTGYGFILVLVSGACIGQWQFFVLLEQTGGRPHLAGYLFANDACTYNFLLHHHLGKTALCFFLFDMVPGFHTYDLGKALSFTISPLWAGAMAVLLAVALGLYFKLLGSVYHAFKNKPHLVLLFVLCALSGFKGVVDGGLLCYRFLPSVVILLAMVCRLCSSLGLTLLTLFGFGVYMAGCFWFDASRGLPRALEAGPLLCLYLLIITSIRPQTLFLRTVRAVSAVGIVVCLAAAWDTAVVPMTAPVDPHTRVFEYVPDEDRWKDRTAGVAGLSPVDIYRRLGENPLKPSRTWIGRPDDYQSFDRMSGLLTFLALDGHHGKLGGKTVRALSASPVPQRNDQVCMTWDLGGGPPDAPPYYTALNTPLTRNNHWVWLHTIAATLKSQGVMNFVLQPLYARSRDLSR